MKKYIAMSVKQTIPTWLHFEPAEDMLDSFVIIDGVDDQNHCRLPLILQLNTRSSKTVCVSETCTS